MDRIVSQTWQAAWLKRYGPSYNSPDDVYNSYLKVIEALDAVGREDIAQALESRVTKSFCAKHAAVLAVIKGLSRRPNSAELIKLPSKFEKQPDVLWSQIIEKEPLVGDHWRDPVFESDSESNGEDATNDSSASLSSFASPSDCSMDLSNDRSESVVVVPKFPPVLSNILTERALIREIRFIILGLKVRAPGNFESNTLSQAALNAILADSSGLAQTLAHIRYLATSHDLLGPAFTKLSEDCVQSILGVRATTILSACSEFEAILGPLVPLRSMPENYLDALQFLKTCFPEMFKSALVPLLVAFEQWLQGQLSFVVVAHDVSPEQIWERMFTMQELPEFLFVPQIENGGKCAWVARQLGLQIPHVKLDAGVDLKWQLLSFSLRNVTLLMDHFRPELYNIWSMLSGVFLGFAPQMLDIIFEAQSKNIGLATGAAKSVYTRNRLQAIILQKWPAAPFYLTPDLLPGVEIPIFMRSVFTLSRLQAFWKRIVTVMKHGSQDAVRLQVEAIELDARVRKGIENAEGLDRLF